MILLCSPFTTSGPQVGTCPARTDSSPSASAGQEARLLSSRGQTDCRKSRGGHAREMDVKLMYNFSVSASIVCIYIDVWESLFSNEPLGSQRRI